MLSAVAGVSEMNVSELELIVAAKMELGRISSQRHHAWLAAEYQLSALKLLQNAALLRADRKTIKTSTR